MYQNNGGIWYEIVNWAQMVEISLNVENALNDVEEFLDQSNNFQFL
jgi:hypothetical protein